MSKECSMDATHATDTPALRSTREADRLPFALLSIVLSASALLPLPGPDGKIWHLPSICPFYQATGLPCPTCGLTRAFVCIAHGRLMESLHWHPLGLPVFAAAVLFWTEYAARVFAGRRLFRIPPRVGSRLAWSSAALLFAVGITRIAVLVVTHTHF
jgi:hypothetical protein